MKKHEFKNFDKIKREVKSNEGSNEGSGVFQNILGLIVIGLLLYKFAPKVFNFVTGGSSDAKIHCGQYPDVLNAKTDRAAKLAYKSCIKRYDKK